MSLCLWIFYFVVQNRKVCYRKKRLNLWSLFINWGGQFLIPTDWIIDNDLCQILFVVLEFFVREGLHCFFLAYLCVQSHWNNRPAPSKWKWTSRIHFDLPIVKNYYQFWTAQSQQNVQFENLYIFMKKLETTNLESR